MKITSFLIFIFSAQVSMAGSSDKCVQTIESYNTHPEISCLNVTSVCAPENGDLQLFNGEAVVATMKFAGKGRLNRSDVLQDIVSAYDGAQGEVAHLIHKSDRSYPHATEYDGFFRLSISTGKKSSVSNANYSQFCTYIFDKED